MAVTPPVNNDPNTPQNNNNDEIAALRAELESLKGTKEEGKETPPDTPPVTQTEDKPLGQTIQDAKAIITEKGIDWNTLEQEFATKGVLSEDTYKALEAKGFPKDKVDSFITAQKVIAEKMESDLIAEVGGTEEYKKVLAFAKRELKPEELDALGKQTDWSVIKLIIKGLKQNMDAKEGTFGKMLQGQAAGGNGKVFNSEHEMKLAINKIDASGQQQYYVDPAYKKDVTETIKRSLAAGIDLGI